MKEQLKQYTYYLIIGLVSLFALAFLPMLGSQVGTEWTYPDTPVGRVVWWTTKIIMSMLNILIFRSFMEQAKINIKDNDNYKAANEILSKVRIKEYKPRSPKKWNCEQYSFKGATIFISTTLATISLTQAILSFDYVSMLTYLFTITMGIIFGILQMKKAELYWTQEYYDYAKLIKEKYKDEC